MNEQEIMKSISISNVMNLLNLKQVCTLGEIIYVKCPFCNSKKGDMKLNTRNNSYICKNCEERGYSIGLYAKQKRITNKEAYKKLLESNLEQNNSIQMLMINNKKSEDYLEQVYNRFLSLLDLKQNHIKKLLSFGFNKDDINNYNFKSIPTNESKKIELCKILINEGFKLSGVPGFFQNKNFKWTFKSHNGLFIPIINNKKIVGLRINLDKKYNTNTTNIWFSSSDKYNGSKINNNSMILFPKDSELKIINSNEKHQVIIATEMLLAYKLHLKFENEIVIGIPNAISKDELEKITKLINIDNIKIVMDFHTIKHSSNSVLRHIINKFGQENLKVYFSMEECDIPKDFKDELKENLRKDRNKNLETSKNMQDTKIKIA